MPRILRLPALAFADLAHFGLELVMRCIELGLELGRVSARVALEHFSVVRHDLVAVFLDVTDRDFDLPRAEAKRDCDKRSLRGAKGDTGLGDLSLAGTGLRRLGRDPSPGLRATSPTPSPGLRPTSPSPSPGLRPTSPTPSPGLRPTSPRGRGERWETLRARGSDGDGAMGWRGSPRIRAAHLGRRFCAICLDFVIAIALTAATAATGKTS